ncbi:MAG: DNA-processing protein DprA [Eggerthellaceae bacterium]|jgi:DNA processing protein
MTQANAAPIGSAPQRRYGPYTGKRIQGPRFVIDQGDPRYPAALLDVERPPQRLYGIGDPSALREGLAVIGARKATPYGKGLCRRFAGEASRRGLVIISGGAYGCDAEAHRAALDAGGTTVVVFGGGCDHVYPARHLALFQEVVDKGGAVLSEHDWTFPAQPYTFRARNRLIAGLARATLIVEAGLPSGTFSTADDALDMGREVLVVPGPITSATSAGTNRLLLQGATPIVDDESFSDALFSIFGILRESPVAPSESGTADPLLAALLAEPMRIDQMAAIPGICDGTAFDALTAATIRLAELESAGLIVRYPDGRYGPKGDMRAVSKNAGR